MNLEREKGFFINSGMIRGVAILSLTLLVVVLIPFIGPVAIIMTPLPILYFCFRLGRTQGLAALTVAFLVVSGILSLLGRPANLSVLIMIGLTGVLLAEVLQRRYSIEKTFAAGVSGAFFFRNRLRPLLMPCRPALHLGGWWKCTSQGSSRKISSYTHK